jgi:hypothetical protein
MRFPLLTLLALRVVASPAAAARMPATATSLGETMLYEER